MSKGSRGIRSSTEAFSEGYIAFQREENYGKLADCRYAEGSPGEADFWRGYNEAKKDLEQRKGEA